MAASDSRIAAYIPLCVATAICGAVFIIVPFLLKRGPNTGVNRTCIMVAAFCVWIFYAVVYISQINPLVGPQLKNTTIAWLARKDITDSARRLANRGYDDSPPPPLIL